MATLSRRTLAASLLAATAMLGMATASAQDAPTRIAVITHGQAADPYWSVVKNGVDAAAKIAGCRRRVSRARHLRHGADGPADRRRRRQQSRRARGLDPRRRRPGAVGAAGDRGRHPGDRHRFRRRQAHPRAGRPALSRPVRVRGRRRRRRARGQARRQEGGLPEPGGRQHQSRRPLRRFRQGPGCRGAGRSGYHRPHRDEGPHGGLSARQPRHRLPPRLRHHRGRAGPGRGRGAGPRRQGQDRHLRPVAGRAAGGDRRQDGVGHRRPAVPDGLHAGGHARPARSATSCSPWPTIPTGPGFVTKAEAASVVALAKQGIR